MSNYFISPNSSIWQETKHPTEKNKKLLEKFILTSSNKGEIVLDFFMGSGTTAVVCEKLERKWIGVEINKEYCNIIKKRLNNFLKINNNLKRFLK